MQPGTLRVPFKAERGASVEAFLCCAWDRAAGFRRMVYRTLSCKRDDQFPLRGPAELLGDGACPLASNLPHLIHGEYKTCDQ